MSDTFAGTGIRSITKVLHPKGDGWREVPISQKYSMGHPSRAFIHRSGLAAISAVEVMTDEDKGPEYHVSISKQPAPGISLRCDSNEAAWVLEQFGLDGADEDNHVPNGIVRSFRRTVVTPLVGLECACKAEEAAIVEDKGDFVWRPVNGEVA